jgi:hypothetical protein
MYISGLKKPIKKDPIICKCGKVIKYNGEKYEHPHF